MVCSVAGDRKGIEMVIVEHSKRLHWNYFLALDSDVERLSRYVEFTESNFATYSIEMAHLLLAAASEVDVVAKLLCKKLNPPVDADNIREYREALHLAFPTISRIAVTIPRYGLELKPWDNWTRDTTPDWWTDYNAVKHERDVNYQRAHLKNTLNAVSALFVLLLHYYLDNARIGNLAPAPALFRVGEEFLGGDSIGQANVSPFYRI